ncbi:MAG: PDZ domain-containing protein [Gemmatimonadota bacterium]
MMIDGRLQTMNRIRQRHARAIAAGAVSAACLLATAPGTAAAQDVAPEAVRRGVIGVQIGCESGDDVGVCAEAPRVLHVTEGGAAEKAGVLLRDRLIAINGLRINSAAGVRAIRSMTAGVAVQLELERAGQPVQVEAIPNPLEGRARVFSFAPRAEAPEGWIRRDSSLAQADRFVFIGPDGRGSIAVRIASPAEMDSVLVEFVPGPDAEARSGIFMVEDADLLRRVQEAEGEMSIRVREIFEELQRAKAVGPPAPDNLVRRRVQAPRFSSDLIAGAKFVTWTPTMAESLGGPENGCLVLRVLADTPAWRIGLREGDIVTEVGGTPTGTLSMLRTAFALARTTNVLNVSWQRRGASHNGVLVTE